MRLKLGDLSWPSSRELFSREPRLCYVTPDVLLRHHGARNARAIAAVFFTPTLFFVPLWYRNAHTSRRLFQPVHFSELPPPSPQPTRHIAPK